MLFACIYASPCITFVMFLINHKTNTTMEKYAANIAKFIINNNIDTLITPMSVIIAAYMKAQDEMYERIEKELMATL